MALCTLWASEVEREPWTISAAIDHSLQAFGHARTCEDNPSAGSSSDSPRTRCLRERTDWIRKVVDFLDAAFLR